MPDRRRFLTILAPVLVLAPACASAGSGGGRVRSSTNVLTEEDLAPHSQESVHDAIRRLRATWMRRRGSGTTTSLEVVQVYVDNVPFGDPDALRNISVSDVVRVEYLNGGDATTRYGTGHGEGAILVFTR